MDERRRREALVHECLSPEAIGGLTDLDFGRVVASLWSSRMWGNKTYLVTKLLEDNGGIEDVRQRLARLLWAPEPLAERYNAFRASMKGFGPAMTTELLAFVHPAECGLRNDRAVQALATLGFAPHTPPLKGSAVGGHDYVAFNTLLAQVRDELRAQRFHVEDLLQVDYYLFQVGQAKDSATPQPVTGVLPAASQAESDDEDFDHGDVIDKLVAVGQWLGFDASKEVKVAKGAVVDTIWRARIANLGVVTYAFEVQSKGSIDSLILNLQKAQNNPSVQRLVVVAKSSVLRAIEQEVSGLPESFRRSLSFMKASSVIRASELVEELSAIVDNLHLVQSEFAVAQAK